MSAQIYGRYGSGEEKLLKRLLPGEVVSHTPPSGGIIKNMILICCDMSEQFTDVFVCPVPEALPSPAREIDLEAICTPEMQRARIGHERHHVVDLTELDSPLDRMLSMPAPQPEQLIIRHFAGMMQDLRPDLPSIVTPLQITI